MVSNLKVMLAVDGYIHRDGEVVRRSGLEECFTDFGLEKSRVDAHTHSGMLLYMLAYDSHQGLQRGVGTVRTWLYGQTRRRSLNRLYRMLQDNSSPQFAYKNWMAILVLSELKKQGVPLHPFVDRQLERVEGYQ
ncbi:hypothetical protein ACFL0V_01255 [Nanoarchaeota archaeon]